MRIIREKSLREFKRKGYDLAILIKSFSDKDVSCLGSYIFKIYSDKAFNESIFDIILDNDDEDSLNILYSYAFAVSSAGFNRFKEMANYTLSKTKDINKIVAVFTSFRRFDEGLLDLVETLPRKAKEVYWESRNIYAERLQTKDLIQVLSAVKKYGLKSVYIDYLYCYRNALTAIDLCKKLLDINNCSGNLSSNDSFELEEILEYLCNQKITEKAKRALCDFEIVMDDYLRWDKTFFVKYCFAKYPEYYFKLCVNYYRGEGENTKSFIDEKYSFSIWYKCQFCPGYVNGIFDESLFDKWIKEFNALMKEHKLTSFSNDVLGRVFAYSPAADDNIIPVKKIREYIERNSDKDLVSSFAGSIINKRGVYTVTAGVDELNISNMYKEQASKLESEGFRECAKIYNYLSKHYFSQSIYEREQAEEKH